MLCLVILPSLYAADSQSLYAVSPCAYSRVNNPTVEVFEELVSALEGSTRCALVVVRCSVTFGAWDSQDSSVRLWYGGTFGRCLDASHASVWSGQSEISSQLQVS